MNTNKSLITVLLLALFSLTALQGINLLLRGNDILGESIGTTGIITPPRCAEYRGTCALNCKTGEKPVPASNCGTMTCCVPMTANILTPQPKPSILPIPSGNLGSIPCAEIDRIQRTYCSNTILPKTTAGPIPTGAIACRLNGERRCNGLKVEICLNYMWRVGEICDKSCVAGKCVITTTPTP